MISHPLSERFWSKVDSSGVCWEWRGARQPRGYGLFAVSGRAKLAHRVSYELSVGQIPAGHSLCHKCDNPGCVNPSHLFVGTQKDNMRDCAAKKRFNNRAGTHNVTCKLTEPQVVAVRSAVAGGAGRLLVANLLGVTKSCVDHIVSRYTWKHLP